MKTLGISDTVRRKDYRAPRVARALRRLLDDPAVAGRARHVGKLVAQEDGAQAAADAIERVFAPGSSA